MHLSKRITSPSTKQFAYRMSDNDRGSGYDINKYASEAIGILQANLAKNLATLREAAESGTSNTDVPPSVSQTIQVSPIDTDTVYEYLNTFDVSANTETDMALWKTDPYHFRTVHLTMQALTKMLTHVVSGGSLEVMGMLLGCYRGNDLFILDCFPLPVAGTESRVDPQNDSYEFMLQYLTKLRESGLRREQVIGWYHSHPGFGCWLSGIDVQTQKLHQGFEDPYVAIVVDPIKSIREGKIDIGAFRTFHETHVVKSMDGADDEKLGWHSKDYYQLDVKLLLNDLDRDILARLEDNMPQYTKLVVPENENVIDTICEVRSGVPDAEYHAIQVWKRFNSLFESVSLDTLRAKHSSIDCAESIDQLSMYSSGIDIKMTNYNVALGRASNPIRGDKKHNEEQDIKLELAEIGSQMDTITIQELRKLLVKRAQYKLFSD